MNDYVESWEFYNKKDKSIARLIKDDYIQIDTDQKDTLYNTYKDDINKGWRKLVLDTDTYTYNAEEVIHSFLYDTNNSNIIKDMRQNERIPNLSGGFRQGFITQKKWDEAYQELISKTSAIMTYDAANAAIVVIEINETEKIVNGQVVFNTAKVTTALSTRMDLLKEKLFYNGFVYTLAGSTQKYLQPARSEDITFVTNQLIAITSKGLDYVDTWNCFLYGEADSSYGFKEIHKHI